MRAISREEGLRVLDLGPTSAANIERITGLGHKLYNEDMVQAAADPALLRKEEDGGISFDLARFFTDDLTYPEAHLDAVLCWDVVDYLPEALVRPMVERLHRVMKPGAILLAYFHTRDAGPEAPYNRYHIVGSDTLEVQRGPSLRLQRVFTNRHIEKLFPEFASIKFFLSRDNIREVLVIR
jgi:SAM-dependent methyltransferase